MRASDGLPGEPNISNTPVYNAILYLRSIGQSGDQSLLVQLAEAGNAQRFENVPAAEMLHVQRDADFLEISQVADWLRPAPW